MINLVLKGSGAATTKETMIRVGQVYGYHLLIPLVFPFKPSYRYRYWIQSSLINSELIIEIQLLQYFKSFPTECFNEVENSSP